MKVLENHRIGSERKTLLLVGGGHGHLHVIKKLQQTPIHHMKVQLLTPSRYQYYSGMFSGYMEGLYSIDDIRVDLFQLTKKSNVQLIMGSDSLKECRNTSWVKSVYNKKAYCIVDLEKVVID